MQLNHKYSKMVSKYINDNIKKKLKEDQVAALCHYSPNHFSRLFHQTFGICFRDYVTELRISLAKKLLLKDSTKVSYIAYQCGYKDASYFGRIFKKKTGFSPANYRKKLINPN
ncbi:helix-turn-helix domain-containing protein [Vibrio azureus]|nr:AraC family transcriptional regulator [Vibrio azureus]